MSTSREISREIKDRTGLAGVKVCKSQGACRFYCDEELPVELSLLECEYAPRLNIYTSSEWADIFEYLLKESGQWDAVRRVLK